MKKNIIFTIISLFIFSNIVNADNNYSYEENAIHPLSYGSNAKQTLSGNVTMIPAGSTFKASLTSGLSSETINIGDNVIMALNTDFYYEGKVVAPSGSTVYGTVIIANKAKRGSMHGKLSIRFNRILTPYGVQIPINAVIKTDDSSGLLVGGTKIDVTKEYAKDIAVGSAGGALSGIVFGALAGGDVGKGAALGTAVGAGGGLIKSIWDKGNNVEIPSGASIDIVLTQPVTVTTSVYSHEN